MRSLIDGLDETDRDRTMTLIRDGIAADRDAALDGHPTRLTDVGPRKRLQRGASGPAPEPRESPDR